MHDCVGSPIFPFFLLLLVQASPHLKIPQSFPLHPFSHGLCHQSCLIFPHLHTQTGWPWWSQRLSAPPSLQHGQDCACPEQAVVSLYCLLVTSVGPQPVCKSKWEQHDMHRHLNPHVFLPWISSGSSLDTAEPQRSCMTFQDTDLGSCLS